MLETCQRYAEPRIAVSGLVGESDELVLPGSKFTPKDFEAADWDLGELRAHEHHALIVRARTFARERPEMPFSMKDLCRGMTRPPGRGAEARKRLSGFPVGKPQVVWHDDWPKKTWRLDITPDSGVAGCIKTRHSMCRGARLEGMDHHGAHGSPQKRRG